MNSAAQALRMITSGRNTQTPQAFLSTASQSYYSFYSREYMIQSFNARFHSHP